MNRGRHKKKPTKYPNTWLTKVMTEEELDLLFKRSREQGNCPSINLIEKMPTDLRVLTSWENTPEGWHYWNKIFSKVEYYRLNHRYYDRC